MERLAFGKCRSFARRFSALGNSELGNPCPIRFRKIDDSHRGILPQAECSLLCIFDHRHRKIERRIDTRAAGAFLLRLNVRYRRLWHDAYRPIIVGNVRSAGGSRRAGCAVEVTCMTNAGTFQER
jgi:hypothetical protein